jgi:hypothetical protein
MSVIRSVNVMSCAKMLGGIYGAMGLLVIPIFLVGGFASLASGARTGALSGIGFVILGVLAPFFYGALGFIFGALGAWAYNLLAKWLGGIQIELVETRPDAPPTSQIGLA